MDCTIESLNSAYQDFILAAAAVLESRNTNSGDSGQALETFKQSWELFRVACDQAEELVESVRQRIGSECLIDQATGTGAAGSAGGTGIPPISAVRLEQMSKAVRWLVIELQHGSGGGATNGVAGQTGQTHLHGPVPPQFEDGPQ